MIWRLPPSQNSRPRILFEYSTRMEDALLPGRAGGDRELGRVIVTIITIIVTTVIITIISLVFLLLLLLLLLSFFFFFSSSSSYYCY